MRICTYGRKPDSVVCRYFPRSESLCDRVTCTLLLVADSGLSLTRCRITILQYGSFGSLARSSPPLKQPVGLPFHFDELHRFIYTGNFLDLLHPYALLTGLVSLSMLVMHGCTYAALKVGEPMATRAASVGRCGGRVRECWAGCMAVQLRSAPHFVGLPGHFAVVGAADAGVARERALQERSFRNQLSDPDGYDPDRGDCTVSISDALLDASQRWSHHLERIE
jgi:hypothetical protein